MTRTRTTRPFADCPLGRYAVVVFWSDDDQCFVADVPDLRYCSASGDTPEEAIHEIQIAMHNWMEAAREHGKPIPEPRYRPAPAPEPMAR